MWQNFSDFVRKSGSGLDFDVAQSPIPPSYNLNLAIFGILTVSKFIGKYLLKPALKKMSWQYLSMDTKPSITINLTYDGLLHQCYNSLLTLVISWRSASNAASNSHRPTYSLLHPLIIWAITKHLICNFIIWYLITFEFPLGSWKNYISHKKKTF